MPETAALEVRRTIRASAERLFAAWTEPAQLRRWWGPEGTSCPHAEVDLRVGGSYRIANLLPSGETVWISGRFEQVSAPFELVYTWRFDPGPGAESRVTVRFEPRGDATEVIVRHEGLAGEAVRSQHEQGWVGCLDGLAVYLTPAG